MSKLKTDYSDRSKEELAILYEQMEERVELFMEECTSMSKTNYTIESLKVLIRSKQEQDIKDWCSMTIADGKDSLNYQEYVLKEVEEQAKEGSWGL